MAGRFRPRELRQGIALDELRRELNEAQKEIAAELAKLAVRRRVTELQIASTVTAQYGDVLRVAPPVAGLRVVLPPVNLERLDSRVTVVVESSSGALSVEVVDGTVNGASTLSFAAGIGTVDFQLTPAGWYAWSASLVLSLPLAALEPIAANTVVANPTSASAVPIAHPWSTVAGLVLTYTAGAINWDGFAVAENNISLGNFRNVDFDDTPSIAFTLTDLGGFTFNVEAAIVADSVSNSLLANMAARRVKLRADGAGTGDPIDGTGAQLGEILRLATAVSDSTSTGTIVTYPLNEATNVVRFLVGVGAAITLRGATIPAEEGQIITWENNDGTGSTVTFNHEDASAAAAGNRFRCPGGVAFNLTAGHRIVTQYLNTRHRIIAVA